MMLKIVLLIPFFYISNLFAMCEYPHNPPAVCLEGVVKKSTPIVHKNYNCLIVVKVKKMLRPADTYIFNSNLDRVDFKKSKAILEKEVKLYSKTSCKLKNIKTVAEYNCNDRNADIPDMALLDSGMIKVKVRDPWTEKNPLIDCQSLLSK